ncbi:hypothetical protein [Chitinophaga qingshengii]|uniref:T9SS C-terminal target domain-containing protein n=1 Tax=Chitinophaga qingshengii TaxID=1569794 RepID=A0ABR7TL79_9BACT|nr:hypothetical protein [Chitinophaga qingshengii]MBC9931252.1 hypothetical protein [Chitinophaga qingshengii]
MNKQLLTITFTSIVAIMTLMSVMSCKKGNGVATDDRAVVAGGPSGSAGSCGDSIINSVITGNITLKSCKIYKLDGLVYVTNNAVMTIEPGTVIKGIKGSSIAVGGGLVITSGAKLVADGTVANPIVFTSNEAAPASGDWCGVVLVGNAPANPVSALPVPGLPTPFQGDVTYGGPGKNISNDNSGILRYVRIEYAGFEQTSVGALNGLTLAGVGNGTMLDFIEVYKAKADAFGMYGGTVNASHLLAICPLDDLFDMDHGYNGTINYALGIADPDRADRSQSNGLETDNNINGDPVTPYTHPTVNYLTVIGLRNAASASVTNAPPTGTGRYGYVAHFRRNSEFAINNAIFLGYNSGIFIDGTLPSTGPNTLTKYLLGISTLNNVYVHAYVTPFAGFTPLGTTSYGYISPDPNLHIKLNAPFAAPPVINNYIPQVSSPARNAGAFPLGNTTWANGWTILQ